MNKIFKVVWSKVKHCYVVVSEIAKNTISGGARRCRVRKGALAAALVTTVLGSSFVMPNSAWAAYDVVGGKNDNTVTFYPNGQGNGGDVTFNAFNNHIYFAENGDILVNDGSGWIYSPVGTVATNDYTWRAQVGGTVHQVNNASILNFAATGAATVSLNGNTLTIGAVDTYTTKVEVNQDSETNIINTTYTTNRKNQEGEDITYSGISFVEGTGISLDANGKEITISATGNAVGNYTWKAKGTSADGKTVVTTINDNGELTFTGTGAANVSLNGNTVTISAVDTRYMVTAGQNNVETSTNAVNTWTFNEVDGEGTGTVIVDTNTTNAGMSVAFDEKGDLVVGVTDSAGSTKSDSIGLEELKSAIDTNNYTTSAFVSNGADGSNSARVSFAIDNGTNEDYGFNIKGAGSVSVSSDGENVVISAVDTNTTYIVEEPVLTDEDAGNVVKKWNIKSQENGKVAYTAVGTVVDTDTKVLSGSVVEGEKGSYGINLVTNEKDSEDREVVVPISGLHDYYTTGVSVYDNNVKFNRNDGGSYTLNFVAGGGSYNESTKEYEDTYVKISVPNGNDNDEIILKTGSRVTASAIEGSDVLKDITINGDTYTLGWDLQVGGSEAANVQTLKFAEGQNVKLDYQNNTITISALVRGYSNDLPAQQSTELLANGSEESSKTAKKQLKMIEINGDLFAVPNIEAVSTSVEGAPVLEAVELNGTVYNLDNSDTKVTGFAINEDNELQLTMSDEHEFRVALADITANLGTMNSWKAKVGEKELNVAESDVVTYTSDSNIVLSAESDENGGGSINVSLNNDIVLQNAAGKETIKMQGSSGTIEVGAKDDKKVTIDGTAGTIAIGNNVYIRADGSATLGSVSIDGTNGSVTVGEINITGTDGNATITGLTNTIWDANNIVSGQAATEDQLQQAISNVTTTLTQSDKYVNYDREYEVTDNEIVLDVVNSDKDVTIKNVAKSSDLGNVGELNSDLKNSGNSHTSIVQAVNRLDDKVNQGWTAKVNGKDVQNIQMGGAQNFVDGKNIKLTADGNDIVVSTATDVTFEKVTVGDVVIDSGGIDAGNKKITNVEAGTEDTDAVNVKQLKEANAHANFNTQHIENLYGQDQYLDSKINQLGSKVNKVGAGSAALAALHPMDFDPDDKLQFSAGVGHYGGENAAALGAFYRPTEKVMFSVAGTMGNGEDMVNAGVTFALDKPNNVSNSRVAMAREIQDLRQQVAALTMLVMQMASRDNAALAGVAMFPDVPENHWAYDYIEGLQKQGIIEGYPDGNFGGDRSMTRYEYAAMLYRALEKGFPVDSRLLNEFNAELGRIRVDRIKGADNDAKKVERVRVNNYEDRDDYGSKIVQVKAGA